MAMTALRTTRELLMPEEMPSTRMICSRRIDLVENAANAVGCWTRGREVADAVDRCGHGCVASVRYAD